MTSARALIALLAIAVVTSSCGGPGQATQASQPLPANLGVIDFPTSGSPEAQEHVLRGAAMLHSFGLEDAALEFRQAQELDPYFAMAYWGEAMSYNHPLQRVQQWDLPKDALMRLGPDREARLAKAPTEREQGFVAAVDSVFFGEAEESDRRVAYADTMERLADRYPDEFYGEILLDLERPADATTQFERALRRMPNRTLSLVGLARAATATDDPDTAREQYQKLLNQWRGADDAAIVQEARAFLAGS